MSDSKHIGIYLYDNEADKIIPTTGGELFHISNLIMWSKAYNYSIFRISLKDKRRKITSELALKLIRDSGKMDAQAYCDVINLTD